MRQSRQRRPGAQAPRAFACNPAIARGGARSPSAGHAGLANRLPSRKVPHATRITHRSLLLHAAAALATALILAGCGGKATDAVKAKIADRIAEKAVESKTGGKAKIDTANGKVEFTTDNGDAKLPDGFPKDVYVYAGAAVKTSIKSEDGFHLILETPDKKDKVLETCAAKMKADGWTEMESMDSDDASVRQYEKDKRTATLNLQVSDDKTQVMLNVTGEKRWRPARGCRRRAIGSRPGVCFGVANRPLVWPATLAETIPTSAEEETAMNTGAGQYIDAGPHVSSAFEKINDVRAFFDNWTLYEKIVERDYLGHLGAYSTLRSLVVERFGEKPFSLLDLGCGDARCMARALAETSVADYEGVDLSAVALELAGNSMQPVPARKKFVQDDFFKLVGREEAPVDIVWIGLSFHHLSRRQRMPSLATATRS